MINLRKKYDTHNKNFVFVKRREEADAVFRAFGNSSKFPYGTLTKDKTVAESLDDCSLLFIKVFNEDIYEVFEKFTYKDLIFSRMVGQTVEKNPHAVLISKADLETAYENYQIGNEK